MTFNYVPKVCPSCNSELAWKGRDLYCLNPACPEHKKLILLHWLKLVGCREVKGIANSLLQAIVDSTGWESVFDVYEAGYNVKNIDTWDNMLALPGIGEAKLNLVKQLRDNLLAPVPLDLFLEGMNIEGISNKTAKVLSQSSNLEQCLKDNTKDKLQVTHLPNIGESVNSLLLKYWDSLVRMYNNTTHLQQEKKPAEPSSKLKVCITGKANDGLTRAEFFKKYEQYIEEASVSSCDYLVCNAESNSSKIKQAQKKGIKVITENELIKLFSVN